MNVRSASAITLSLITLGNVQAQVDPPAVADSNVFLSTAVPLTPAGPTENAVGPFGGSQSMQQMRERLKDPAQRTLLRAEQRANLLQSHAEVGRVLGIDAATESALIELLTDQQMEQLDLFHLRMTNPTFARESIYDQAARQTRRIEVRRELLGERRLEQYQAFEKTLGKRTQVRQLDARLDPAHKLTWEQTEQLVLLYEAHHARWRDKHQLAFPRLENTFETMPNPEELQRRALLMTIATNEDAWRRMADYHRTLMDQAAALLTAPQLAMLSKIQSEEVGQQQQRIEKLREQAGLSPRIPAASSASSDAVPARTERDGDVRVSIRLSIDRKEPAIYSQVVRNGSLVTFDAGDGLFVDATPTLYEDGLFNLRLAYHEAASTGRRLLGETQQTGDLKNQTAATDLAHSGGSSGIIVGRKAYAVELNARVEGI